MRRTQARMAAATKFDFIDQMNESCHTIEQFVIQPECKTESKN